MSKITREQAEQALAAVKRQFARYTDEIDQSGHAFEALTGDALTAHLDAEHGVDAAYLAHFATPSGNRAAQTPADVHTRLHTPEALYTEHPVLVEDWNGEGWAISWECGPDEWAYRATMGGTSEEERVLAAQAAQEFGADPKTAVAAITPDEPVTWPAGVHAEPYYSFVLTLYPDA